MLPEIKINNEDLNIIYDIKFPNSSECDAYYCTYKNQPKVIKIFKDNNIIEEKTKKIKLLKKRLENIPEIVTADAIIYDKEIIGYIMPYINGNNLCYTCKLNREQQIYLYKELSNILKKIHKLNIIAADFGNNTLYTPDNKLFLIDHDNFSIDNYNVNVKNFHFRLYEQKIKTIDEHFDDYLLNIYTIAGFKNILADVITCAYNQYPYKFNFKDQKITKIFENTMNLNETYNEELIIDRINTVKDLRKIKTRIF